MIWCYRMQHKFENDVKLLYYKHLAKTYQEHQLALFRSMRNLQQQLQSTVSLVSTLIRHVRGHCRNPNAYFLFTLMLQAIRFFLVGMMTLVPMKPIEYFPHLRKKN